MEQVREVNITLEIDTNKRTIQQSFQSIEDLQSYVESLPGELSEHLAPKSSGLARVDLGRVLITVGNQVVGPDEIEKLRQARHFAILRPREATPPEDMSPETHRPVPVSEEKFAERLWANARVDYVLPLNGWQVPIIHGLVALAADHPGVQSMSQDTQEAIRHVRDWCKAVFIDWGLSPGEAVYLDTMREGESGT